MSLRRRLVLGFLVVAVALVAGGVFLAVTMRQALIDRVDQQLAAVRPDRFGFGQIENPARLSEYYFATLDADRQIVRSSQATLATADEPPPASAALSALALDATNGATAVGTVPREDGHGSSYRVRITRSPVPDLANGYFVVAQSLRDVDRTFRRIVIAESITALAVLATLAVVAEWVLRQGVRPLDDIAATADAIAGGDLSRRVATTKSPLTEAGRVGIAFNRMLGQIEDDIRQRKETEQRLKRFIADASHELRTPLTSIRGYADLWRQGGLPDGVARDDAMRRVEDESARMGRLVDDLLLLARLDEGIPLASNLVDLSKLASECVTDARVVDPERTITLAGASPVEVVGDEDRLRQVISNLIVNARTHTPAKAAIHVRTARTGTEAIVEVRDEGSGMDAATAARVFDRFYRADPARSRSQGGSGLGLAIVAAIVSSHRGTVAVDTAPGRGARFVVALPLAPSMSTSS